MSFAASMARLNKQAAAHRAATYGVSADPANPSGPNLQLGEVSGVDTTWGATFRGPFDRLATAVNVIAHGRTLTCTAAIQIPTALGLTYTAATLFKHIATGEIYDVGQLHDSETSGYTRVLLRRREA